MQWGPPRLPLLRRTSGPRRLAVQDPIAHPSQLHRSHHTAQVRVSTAYVTQYTALSHLK